MRKALVSILLAVLLSASGASAIELRLPATRRIIHSVWGNLLHPMA